MAGGMTVCWKYLRSIYYRDYNEADVLWSIDYISCMRKGTMRITAQVLNIIIIIIQKVPETVIHLK